LSGELDLAVLLKTLTAELADGVYVFVTLPDRDVPGGVSARMLFQEEEGTTLILLREVAEAHGLSYEFPSRMITLNVHSSLDAVGFIARIATELAKAGLGVNPVAGFFHDHIFVPDGRAHDAIAVLEEIAKDAGQSAGAGR